MKLPNNIQEAIAEFGNVAYSRKLGEYFKYRKKLQDAILKFVSSTKRVKV